MPEIITSSQMLFVWVLFGYLLGSIPFGVIVARAMNLGDLRKIGSGNIGATNVLRTGSKKAAVLTLLLDGGKGAAAVLIVRACAAEDAVQLAGLAAFIGHCFPVWLGFRGGKGVATFIGLMLALSWPVGIAACLTWLLIAALFRFSSLAALAAAGFAPIWSVYLTSGDVFILGIVLAALIYLRHWQNIQRLRKGTETKIGQKG